MSLESAAETIADQIRRQEFVEVFAHHDADGIAAASILCHAMLRCGYPVPAQGPAGNRQPADLTGDSAYLLCDLGSGMERPPAQTSWWWTTTSRCSKASSMQTRVSQGLTATANSRRQVPPTIVAQQMGDNRDLAGSRDTRHHR